MNDKSKLVFTMDLEAVLLSPALKASAVYYKTKLAVHNFTLFNLASKSAKCYVWHEGEAGLVGSVFASIVVDFIEGQVNNDVKEVILYSDGCTYQNRNNVMSNALLKIAVSKQITLYQKFLEKGHTQMECDSMHSCIERVLKKRDIYVPADYLQIFRSARQHPEPYEVVYLDHSFFKDYTKIGGYSSIRPGNMAGDPVVTDVRGLRYSPDGTIAFKTDYQSEWKTLPRHAKPVSLLPNAALQNGCVTIKTTKFIHLQELKKVIPSDHHHFYNSLVHECSGQCNHILSA